MRFLSVCSGIEAASVAWAPLGWKAVAFSEIEPFPCSVLEHHYPSVPNWGDMTKFQEWPDATVDLLCGGTPCQSFSVAGLRGGLADPRGNLMLTFLAIASRYRPQWVVWENVPGVLSSNGGRDFGSFLGGLAVCGYGFAYRVLDAQHFGLAQRRKRVFVVGCLGSWQRAAAVLFERASLSGHPAPSREEREGSAIRAVVVALPSGGTPNGHGTAGVNRQAVNAGHVIPTLTATYGQDYMNGLMALQAQAFDARQSGVLQYGDKTGPLDTNGQTIGVLAFNTTQVTSNANVSNPKPGDPCHPLAAGAHAPAIAFSCKDHGADASNDLAPTLRAMGHSGSHANAGRQMAVAIDCYNGSIDGDTTLTLRAGNSNELGGVPATMSGMSVRRLTPRECERLQGFEDDYTLIPYRGKDAADGPRYRALGNSWAINVVSWIGRRIAAVSAIERNTNV